MNANHTGNILVYCLTGSEFRTQLFHVIGKNSRFVLNRSSNQFTGTFNRDSISQTSSRKQMCSTIAQKTRLIQVN